MGGAELQGPKQIHQACVGYGPCSDGGELHMFTDRTDTPLRFGWVVCVVAKQAIIFCVWATPCGAAQQPAPSWTAQEDADNNVAELVAMVNHAGPSNTQLGRCARLWGGVCGRFAPTASRRADGARVGASRVRPSLARSVPVWRYPSWFGVDGWWCGMVGHGLAGHGVERCGRV